MGKTVAVVIGVVASVAIAIAAPYLAPIALHALGIAITTTSVAIAAALITTGLAVGLGLAFRAIGVGPVTAWGGGPAPFPPGDHMPPVNLPWLFRVLAWHQGHWRRFSVHRLHGNCMNGVKHGSWALIDRRATIRRGDLFAFRLSSWSTFTIGRVKRFLGCSPATGSFDWQMDNPSQHHCDQIAELEWAFRVCFVGPSLWSALAARFRISGSGDRERSAVDVTYDGEIVTYGGELVTYSGEISTKGKE